MDEKQQLAGRIRDYWQNAAPAFGTGRAHGGLARLDGHPLWLAVVADVLSTRPGNRPIRRVADLGCGAGGVAEVLARLGYQVIAVDFASAMAERARDRLAAHPGVTVRVGDAHEPPIEAGEVDAVLSRNLVWLLTDPPRAVRRWSELAGPGGRIAAIDGTWHPDHWTDEVRWRLRRGAAQWKSWRGDGPVPAMLARDNPNRGAPLARMRDPSPVVAVWKEVGLEQVEQRDLAWVDAVERLPWTRSQRWLNRWHRFAVIGTVPGREAGG